MSDIIINVELDEGVVMSTTPDDDVVVNIIEEAPVIINMCDNNGLSTNDYNALHGKPKVNGVELIGDKSLDELGIEPKKGNDDNYVTDDEKGKLDRLLVDFIVPSDTPSLTFDRDKNGVLFSELELRVISVHIYMQTTLTLSANIAMRINDVSTNTYKSSSSLLTSFIPVRAQTEACAKIDLAVLGVLCYGSTSFFSPSITDTSDGSILTYRGINRHIDRIDRISIFGTTIKAGSTIKIYRND